VAVALVGPLCKAFASHSRRKTIPARHHSIFTDWMFFLMLKQQHQSIEGNRVSSFLTAHQHIIGHSVP